MEFWNTSTAIDEDFALEVRTFLERNVPESWKAHPFARPFDWGFHKRFIEWQREHLPEATSAQLAAFRREVDRFGIESSNFSPTNLVARTLELVGTDEQKATYMADFDSGDARCALGYTEPDSGSDVAAAKTRAIRDGDEWVISGQKMFTSAADSSTHVFLLTRTNLDVPKHDGLTLFLVPLDAPGVEIRLVDTLGEETTCMTFYSDVRVPDSARVGEVDGGWSVMRTALDLEHGVGGMRLDAHDPARRSGRRADPADVVRSAPVLGEGSKEVGKLLARTVAWASEERGADGSRPIDDPLVRERLARIAVEDEIGRLLARRNDPLKSKPGVGNAAKLWWTELYLRASSECLDIVGADGLLPFSEPQSVEDGWFQHAFRDAPVWTIAGGVSEVQLDVIAERRLGLPRSRSKK